MSLFDAIKNNDYDESARLIKKGADVNELSPTCGLAPLDLAIMGDRRDIVLLLRENGAKPDYVMKKFTDFVRGENCDFLEFILNVFKINLEDKQYFAEISPLNTAICCNERDKVLLLLKYGANPLISGKCKRFEHTERCHAKINAFEFAILSGKTSILHLMTTFLIKKNNAKLMLTFMAREFDKNSLLHRDYLPLDMFRLIFRSR